MAQYLMPAEWAPHTRCWMAWPCDAQTWGDGMDAARRAYAQVANTIQQFEPVVMVARDEDLAAARPLLDDNVRLLGMALNDSWMRDFGPTFVIDRSTGRKHGVTWRFNGWGKRVHDLDREVGANVLADIGVPRIPSSLVNEGGAVHVDGEGTCLLTETVQLNANRNPGLDRAAVERELREMIGVTTCIWLPAGIIDDETDGHVDELACFVRPGMVLALTTGDRDDANYDILQTNLDILRSSVDARGRALQVLTVEQPAAAYFERGRLSKSYINFYIANGGILMPVYGEPAADGAALEVLRRCFPQHRLVPVDSSQIVRGGGNIHCITQQEPQA